MKAVCVWSLERVPYLGIEHDFWRPVPSGGHVLRQEAGVIVLGIGYACKTEITNLQRAKTRVGTNKCTDNTHIVAH